MEGKKETRPCVGGRRITEGDCCEVKQLEQHKGSANKAAHRMCWVSELRSQSILIAADLFIHAHSKKNYHQDFRCPDRDRIALLFSLLLPPSTFQR